MSVEMNASEANAVLRAAAARTTASEAVEQLAANQSAHASVSDLLSSLGPYVDPIDASDLLVDLLGGSSLETQLDLVQLVAGTLTGAGAGALGLNPLVGSLLAGILGVYAQDALVLFGPRLMGQLVPYQARLAQEGASNLLRELLSAGRSTEFTMVPGEISATEVAPGSYEFDARADIADTLARDESYLGPPNDGQT